MADASSSSYCARELKRHDRDRYLTCLFAPVPEREALFALYAFNLEVAKTAEIVSEPMLGRIRLQWWREAIEEVYEGRPRRHEVVSPLGEAVRRHGLSRGHFERLIDGREFDLEGEAPATLERLEAYGEATSASVVQLALEILGAASEADRTAGLHVGVAWSLTGLLRAVPFHARQKRLYLPRDLIEEADLKVGDLFELRSSPQLNEIAARIAGRARARLAKAARLRRQTTRTALPALLPATLANRYLAVLEKAGHDPFALAVQSPAPNNIWRLAWARLLGRY